MHFVISATWGPTDPTRALLPFIFAASALQAGDAVTIQSCRRKFDWRLDTSQRPTPWLRVQFLPNRSLPKIPC